MSEVKGPIAPFKTIGEKEAETAYDVVRNGPLSGFLGGQERGGYWVRALEDAWAERFGVRHAVCCNSATSGLMAAAFAVGLKQYQAFAVSPYTMSATVAAPMFIGASPFFIDVEDQTFCMNPEDGYINHTNWKVVIITNLFGHPSQAMDLVTRLPKGCFVIEDNSQAPFAMEGGCYAGTFGDIGVSSFNVHKHLQCGEGGICTTDDDELAGKMRATINHGEMAGGAIGLNLRLNEVSAAIALEQLNRADEIIAGRIEQAEEILYEIGDIPGIRMPLVRQGCKSVWYAIPFLIEAQRDHFLHCMEIEGVPLVEGYVNPLYRLPAFSQFARKCPVAEDLYDRRLFLFENCAWSPTKKQIKQIGSAFRKVAEEMKL